MVRIGTFWLIERLRFDAKPDAVSNLTICRDILWGKHEQVLGQNMALVDPSFSP